jgi:hypothetical protein
MQKRNDFIIGLNALLEDENALLETINNDMDTRLAKYTICNGETIQATSAK